MGIKKWMGLWLITVLIAASAAGCGGTGGSGGTGTSGTTAEIGTTTSAAPAASAASDSSASDQLQTSTAGQAAEAPAVADNLGEVRANGNYQFGFTICTRDQFLSALEASATENCAALGVKMTVVDANNNANTQIQNVQTFASQGCDVIIVNLVNTDNAQQIIEAANGIPIVFVNRMPGIELESEKTVYVGSDETDAGRFQGEYLADFFKQQNKTDVRVVMLTGLPGLQNTVLRTDAAKAALEAAGIRATYVYEDTAEWDRSKAQNKMQTFIGTGQAFDCVIANNDEMALGAIEAMKASGLDLSVIPVAGIDATPAGLEAMSRGELAFSVFQNPVGQGGGCVRAATLIANGEAVDTVVGIPFEPVSATNFKDYMN